jgi:hypothetical protein
MPGTGFDIELEEWDDILREVIDRHVVDFLKRRTHAGLPCGDRKFLVKMGEIAGMDFLEKKSGRPSKQKA